MSNGTTQHIRADVRERVAREVYALDADWRREYWDQFRRDFPRIAQAYYDTADRILAILRTPRGEREAWRAFLDALDEFESAANLWVDPEGPTAEDMARLDRARLRVIECGRALAARSCDARGDGPVGAVCANCGAPNAATAGGELDAALERERRLREALERVAENGCERFHGVDCWQLGMDPDAEEYAARVCDPCYARRALAADPEARDGE